MGAAKRFARCACRRAGVGGRIAAKGDEIMENGGTPEALANHAASADEQKFKSIFRHAASAMAVLDLRGDFLEVNPALCDLLGYPEDKLRRMNIRAVSSPDDLDLDVGAYRQLIKGEIPFEWLEKCFLHRNGHLVWGMVSRSVIRDGNGHARYIVISVQDITQRKQAMEALRFTQFSIDHAADAAFWMGAHGRIFYVNESACKALGYPREELLRMSIYQIDPNFQPQSWGEHWAELKAKGSLSFESVHRTRQGKVYPVEIIANYVEFEGQEYNCAFARDISERKRAQEALRSSESQLVQAQKMEALGTLVAGVAHEINNPINLILYNIPILQGVWKDFLPVVAERAQRQPHAKYGGMTFAFLKDKLGKLLADMDMAANRITKIVSDLKDFSRQSNVAEMALTDINEAVGNAVRLARAFMRKAQVSLEMDLAEDMPPVKGNLHSIAQVVLNVLINAVQAVDHNHGRVQIATGVQSRDGRPFIAVTDNGRGVAAELGEKIFDPFVTDKQDSGGTGLGLSVSYNLIRAHGGEIVYHDSKQGGAVFKVLFPAQTLGETLPARILVVDDEDIVRRILVKVLTRKGGYLVEEAANGIEAGIKLGSYHPDLVVLDLQMPDMDGLEVCRIIKSNPDLADIKVIITTGFPDHPKLEQISALGFKDFCFKPIRGAEFLDRLERVLAD
jgi:PAS domain S-box-containing protein